MADVDPIPSDPLAWRPQVARPSRRSRPVTDPLIEPHWLGDHVLVHIDTEDIGPDGAARCRFVDEHGDDVTDREPDLAAAVRDAIRATDVVLDGYLTDQATRPGTSVSVLPVARRTGNILVGHRMDPDIAVPLDDGDARPTAFVAVDLLRVDGQVLFDVPLLERKRILDSLIEEAELVRVSPYTKPPVDPWMRTWRAAGFDGLVLKAANSRYRPGHETDDWTISLATPGRQ